MCLRDSLPTKRKTTGLVQSCACTASCRKPDLLHSFTPVQHTGRTEMKTHLRGFGRNCKKWSKPDMENWFNVKRLRHAAILSARAYSRGMFDLPKFELAAMFWSGVCSSPAAEVASTPPVHLSQPDYMRPHFWSRISSGGNAGSSRDTVTVRNGALPPGWTSFCNVSPSM